MKEVYAKVDLLTTSSVTDIVELGGMSPSFKVGGLNAIRFADLASVTFKKAKAEVAKVETIGTTTPTIVAGEKYIITIYNPLNTTQSTYDDAPKKYTASLATLSGVAATDRQNIYNILTQKINDDPTNGVVASAGSGGTGMTITDDGNYLSGAHNEAFGGKYATSIQLIPDEDGAGFTDATHRVVTTPAQYAIGVGTTLAKWGTTVGPYGWLALESQVQSSELNNAVSGQLYNFFGFESVQPVNYDIKAGVSALNVLYQNIWVDNGEGSSTTNLAGYRAFEYKLERIVYNTLYKNSPSSLIGFFAGSIEPAKLKGDGGLPTGTAGDENVYHFADQNLALMQSILGTQTILYSPIVATGLRLTQDAADNDGMEFHPSYDASSPHLITVGSGTYSIRARVQIGDISDTDEVHIGFREAVAVEATFTGYEDYAALAIDATDGSLKMRARDAAGTAKSTDTAINWADGGVHYLEVRLHDDGTTEFLVDDVDYTHLIAAADVITHTAGQTLIPYIRVLNAAAGDPEVDFANLLVIPDIINREKFLGF